MCAGEYSGINTFKLEAQPSRIAYIAHNDDQLDQLHRIAKLASIVAFDAEWQPGSRIEDGVNVLQLAFPEEKAVFVLHISVLTISLLNAVFDMFLRPTCTVIGFGARQDQMRLRFTSPLLADLRLSSILDIQVVAGERANLIQFGIGKNIGGNVTLDFAHDALLSPVVGAVLRKDSSVTVSSWAAAPLSVAQVQYAAMDAWATLQLYIYMTITPPPAAVAADLTGALSTTSIFSSGGGGINAGAASSQEKVAFLARMEQAEEFKCQWCPGAGPFNSKAQLISHQNGKKCKAAAGR
jgi:hypothetical protein